jgi:hypothetical protein
VRNGSSVGLGVEGAGVGVVVGSAFSACFDFGAGVGDPPFFFALGDLSLFGVELFFDAFFDFGVGDLVEAGVGLPFFAGVLVGSGVASESPSSSSSPVVFGDAFNFGVGDSSASPGVFSALGVLVASGVALAFAFVFGVGVGLGVFFAFDFLVAGFGLAAGEGVTDGVGEVTARISSRAFFFFSSSADCP